MDTQLHTPAEVFAKLGELEPGEIAKVLHDLGIQGRRKVAEACPLAQYVAAETANQGAIVGFSSWVTPDESGKMPDSVRSFVKRFDAGYYPELDSAEPQDEGATW